MIRQGQNDKRSWSQFTKHRVPPPPRIGLMKSMFRKWQHEFRIRFPQDRILWHRVPPPTPHHRINEVDVYRTMTRFQNTISKSSCSLASGAPTPTIGSMKSMFTKRQHESRIRFLQDRILLHRAPPTPYHRINEVDIQKITTRVKDTISARSYPLAAGAPTPYHRNNEVDVRI